MILTKEHQEAAINAYIKEKHNQDECIGFIDGFEKAMSLVKNCSMHAVSNNEVAVCLHYNHCDDGNKLQCPLRDCFKKQTDC